MEIIILSSSSVVSGNVASWTDRCKMTICDRRVELEEIIIVVGRVEYLTT